MGIFGLKKSKEALREDGLKELERGNARRGAELLEKAAGQGDVEAMICLGRFYDGAYPSSGLRDSQNALSWFTKAAGAGSAEAALLAGKLLSDKKLFVYSNRRAAAWFERAAAMGNVEAMVRAGKLYLYGAPSPHGGDETVYINSEKALKYLEAAAEAGDTEARYLCGNAYFYGRDAKLDQTRGVEYLKQAAEGGHAVAQYTMGLAYQSGSGVPQDRDEAIRWFRQAAENGDVSARKELGRIYFEGDGVAKDMDEAFRWYQQAAKGGGVEAKARLAKMYHDGLGTKADIHQAIWWMQRAADDDEDLKDTLRCYMEEANAEKIAWFEEKTEAVAATNPKTKVLMKQAAVDLGLENHEEGYLAGAYSNWEMASEAGDADASFNCGICCLLGLGTSESQDEAETYFTRAADQGDSEAARNLAHKPLDYHTLPCQKLRLPPEERQWILEDLHGED